MRVSPDMYIFLQTGEHSSHEKQFSLKNIHGARNTNTKRVLSLEKKMTFIDFSMVCYYKPLARSAPMKAMKTCKRGVVTLPGHFSGSPKRLEPLVWPCLPLRLLLEIENAVIHKFMLFPVIYVCSSTLKGSCTVRRHRSCPSSITRASVK